MTKIGMGNRYITVECDQCRKRFRAHMRVHTHDWILHDEKRRTDRVVGFHDYAPNTEWPFDYCAACAEIMAKELDNDPC